MGMTRNDKCVVIDTLMWELLYLREQEKEHEDKLRIIKRRIESISKSVEIVDKEKNND
jgi:hypothetical protein